MRQIQEKAMNAVVYVHVCDIHHTCLTVVELMVFVHQGKDAAVFM